MNEDEQVIWGQPISFLDFVLRFLSTPNLRRVELVPKTDPLKFYIREKVAPPSQDLGEIRDANKERVNKSLSNYASNNFLLSTSNIRPDLNGRYNPGLGLFAGDLTALTLSMGFDPFNASNYYKVATLIPKFRNWGLTRLLANELNNEVRVAGELGKNVGKSTVSPIIRTKIGDVEINNPELYYHLSGLGKAKNFFNTNRMRTPQEEYWLKLEHVPLTLRTGVVPGFPQNPGRAMFSLGKLWYGLNPEQFPDLLVTAKEMPVANSKAGIVKGSLLKLESQGTRRVTSDNIDNIGPHTNQNTSAYTYIPGYGYRQIQLEPKTSLRFFTKNPKLAKTLTDELWDAGYLPAVKNKDLVEAQTLRDLHFGTKSGNDNMVFAHTTPNSFTIFDKSYFGRTDDGFNGKGFYFSTTRIPEGPINYKGIRGPRGEIPTMNYGKNKMYVYLKGNREFDIGNPERNFFNEPDVVGVTGKTFDGKPHEVIIGNPNNIKLTDAITYDNQKNIIPLSMRDNFINPDIRYLNGGKIIE